jgi:glutaminyl-peptide cyclotransferase
MTNPLSRGSRPPRRPRPTRTTTGPCAALALALLLTACGGGDRESKSPFDAARAFEHVETMVGFGPRPSGSAANRQQAEWLMGELKSYGLSPVEQTFQEDTFGKTHELDGEVITFRNVHCVVPGSDPEKGPFIVLGAHIDSKRTHGHAVPEQNFEFVGAIDGAGASAVMLELARVLAVRNRELVGKADAPKVPNLWFVWFDGEENLEFDWVSDKEDPRYNDDQALFGSRHFVAELERNKLLSRVGAMVLADLIGDKAIKIDRDLNSNKSLQDTFLAAADELGERGRMYAFQSEFTDDHLPFVRAGIPSVLLIDFAYRIPAQHESPEKYGPVPEIAKDLQAWWHTPEDTVDKMAASSLGFVGDLIYTALPKIESSPRIQRKFK